MERTPLLETKNLKKYFDVAGGKLHAVDDVSIQIYEGETLPDDIVCPLCKHGAADFEPIG